MSLGDILNELNGEQEQEKTASATDVPETDDLEDKVVQKAMEKIAKLTGGSDKVDTSDEAGISSETESFVKEAAAVDVELDDVQKEKVAAIKEELGDAKGELFEKIASAFVNPVRIVDQNFTAFETEPGDFQDPSKEQVNQFPGVVRDELQEQANRRG